MKRKNNWHVEIAAEAIAAAQLARCKWDVSVQYGANLPEYDLIAARKGQILKVSVKGSSDLGWGLTQGYLEERQKLGEDGRLIKLPPPDYHKAIDAWLTDHTERTVFFLVQFGGVDLGNMPRCYLAAPQEIATQLKSTARGRGDTVLYERQAWSMRAHAAGTIDEIPASWRFSEERLEVIANLLCPV